MTTAKPLITGEITWSEIDGRGVLTLTWEDGERERVVWPKPIAASSDSQEIAGAFGFYPTDHDNQSVFVCR